MRERTMTLEEAKAYLVCGQELKLHSHTGDSSHNMIYADNTDEELCCNDRIFTIIETDDDDTILKTDEHECIVNTLDVLAELQDGTMIPINNINDGIYKK